MVFLIAISIIFMWLPFGWLTMRMAYYDDLFKDEDIKFGLLFLGPIGWVVGMLGCNEPGARRKAHFIPIFKLPKFKISNEYKKRFIGVK